MAKGSAATARQELLASGYSTKRNEHRCDTCAHHHKPLLLSGATRYDLLCTHFPASVKTHGGCSKWTEAA